MNSYRTSRRDFVKALGLGAAAFSLPGCAKGVLEQRGRRPPNFVLILLDDLGWADVGCYGSTYHETPNIDRLAAQGMKFINGYAACAVCSPTRASIMTGRYPARVGITDWIRARFQGAVIPEDKKNPEGYTGSKDQKVLCPQNSFWMELDEVTLAEALKATGYTCSHVGKWHLGPDDWYPEHQGFDFNIGGCDRGHPPGYFDPYESAEGNIPTLKPRRKGEYLTDREADEAVKFIAGHKEQPFFLYLAHYAVHTPIQAKPELVEKYKKKKPTRQKEPAYAAMVESVDQALGRMLKTLEECDLARNTLVLFTSDNGGYERYTSNAPLRSGKGYPYEGGIRVPLIVRWPAVIEPGSECRVPVMSADFFPTFCEAAGARLPRDRAVDGESLMPLLTGKGRLKRDAIYWHFPHYRGRDCAPYSIIREGDWKLIKRYDGKSFELFHLGEDPSEENDLAEALPERVGELDQKLIDWLKEVGAKAPIENPDYDPSWKPPGQ